MIYMHRRKKAEMKNEPRESQEQRRHRRGKNSDSYFAHEDIISRLFDSIFEMDTGSTIYINDDKKNKIKKTNSKTKKGKK